MAPVKTPRAPPPPPVLPRDWVVSIVKDVVREMVANGELQAVSQSTPSKPESPMLAADDLADLGGVMGMFRSKE